MSRQAEIRLKRGNKLANSNVNLFPGLTAGLEVHFN